MSVPALEIAHAYKRCEQITRHEAANFYYGIRLLPRQRRDAMCAVYAFARRIDDIGDEGDDHDAQLQALRFGAKFTTPSQVLSMSFTEGEHQAALRIEGCQATLRAKCVLISTGTKAALGNSRRNSCNSFFRSPPRSISRTYKVGSTAW